MEQHVIIRDRQEVPSTDYMNLQEWGSEAQEHLTLDAITTENQFTGLTVTEQSATEIEVAPGRLYQGSTGKTFPHRLAETVSVFSYRPLQDEKWLAISVQGIEEDTNSQPRDFLINLETGQTQPQIVAIERRRSAQVHIAQGLESPTPEKPEPPTGYTLIAHVRMSPSGIQEIVLATARYLPNLHAVNTRLQEAEGWIRSAEPRIAHIMSDIAGLGEAVAARATIEQTNQIAMDMVRLKERLEIPDDYVFYGGDHFLTEDESDTEEVGYDALIQEGLRVPVAAEATVAMSLQNPLDPAAKVSADGFLLPAYNEFTRLRMETRKGELQINQYQYQTQNIVQRSMARERIQYGETRDVCSNSAFWKSGKYDATTGIFRRGDEAWLVAAEDRARLNKHVHNVRLQQFWTSTSTETYWEAVTEEHTVLGSILAQTLLMAQTGWLTSIDLFFASADPAGGLTLMICDASRGEPDMNHVIARVTYAANALSAGWCRLPLPRPVFVESGKRYAVVLSTAAQHRVGYTEGIEYTQGVLLYAQDGAFFSLAAERDLMLRLQFAQFTTPRAVIQMEPLQLVGGIGDIDALYEGVTPDGCSVGWEYQVSGIWYPMTDRTAANLATLPALLQLRAVFIGTTDLMPGVQLDDSQWIVSRPETAFTHFSTERTLGGTSDEIVVRLLLEHFDDTPHNVGCQLIISGSPENPDSTKDEVVDDHLMWREYRFQLGAPVAAYVIKITGSTTSWRNQFHVVERYDLAL